MTDKRSSPTLGRKRLKNVGKHIQDGLDKLAAEPLSQKILPGQGLVRAMLDAGLVSTHSQARRFVAQGAVKIGGLPVQRADHMLPPGTHTVTVGKKGVTITVPEK
jgi:tyrosyl-tRNA synthetase